MGRLPAAIEEIIGSQPQAVTAPGVLRRIVGPEPRHVGVEGRAADHPGRRRLMMRGVPPVRARVRRTFASFFVERPASQQLRTGRPRQGPVARIGPRSRPGTGPCRRSPAWPGRRRGGPSATPSWPAAPMRSAADPGPHGTGIRPARDLAAIDPDLLDGAIEPRNHMMPLVREHRAGRVVREVLQTLAD